jgi:hypothetical protein
MSTQNLPDAEILYFTHWIKEGLSLRKIGRMYGTSRTSVMYKIRERYGKDACNPKMNGLARVVAQEYGDTQLETTKAALNVPGKYLTGRKEKNLSTFQSIEFLDNFPTDAEDSGSNSRYNRNNPLRLPYFILFTSELAKTMEYLLAD